ncbi:MAG: hypothetical protein ACTSP3_17350, partial [Candidatus Heimdallarchaeaceae archaeon]
MTIQAFKPWKKMFFLVLSFMLISQILVYKQSQGFVSLTLIKGNPEIEFKGEYFDAYNMFVLERRDLSDYHTVDKTLYIVDMEGNIIIEKDIG